ncbi:hypothetical protein BJ742DRAFT_158437 [Cladochytrium replicatum]|nr:hypothetical protein BJ742DRAFT_158437 [Cladochytrium replicatum]
MVRTSDSQYNEVFQEELNTNFDVQDTRFGLWRVAFVLPPGTPADTDPTKPSPFPSSSVNNTMIDLAEEPSSSSSKPKHTIDGIFPITDEPVPLSERTSPAHSPSRPHYLGRPSRDLIDDWSAPPSADALAAAAALIIDEEESDSTALIRGSSAPGSAAPIAAGPATSRPHSTELASAPGLPAAPARRVARRSPSLGIQGRAATWTVPFQKLQKRQQFTRSGTLDPHPHPPPSLPPPQEKGTPFEVIFSFHHSLGDGLSLFTWSKSFFKTCTADVLNAPQLELSKIPVVKEEVPLLDNLVDPSVVEVIPVAIGMLLDSLKKVGVDQFRGRADKRKLYAEYAESNSSGNGADMARAESTSPSNNRPEIVAPSTEEEEIFAITLNPAPAVPDSSTPDPPPATSGHSSDAATEANKAVTPVTFNDSPYGYQSKLSKTRVRFVTLDEDVVTALRKRCKAEKTTIAGALVVAALSGVRSIMETLPEYKNRTLPGRQGWVVTNSARHLLPQSRLLFGGDKQSDPSIDVFGGYAGSVNSITKLVDRQDFWERARYVRSGIARCFRVSLQRQKLMNYCYRHPKLYNFIERHANLEAHSRAFSIELANLGAWDYPQGCVSADQVFPQSSWMDEEGLVGLQNRAHWLRLDKFFGVVNSSFDGVRALFTLGVITLGGAMSVAIGYDSDAVHEEDAEVFVSVLKGALRVAGETQGRVSIGKAREAGAIEIQQTEGGPKNEKNV